MARYRFTNGRMDPIDVNRINNNPRLTAIDRARLLGATQDAGLGGIAGSMPAVSLEQRGTEGREQTGFDRRDQAGEETNGVVCPIRLSQDGSTGDWKATDGNGRPLVVRSAGDGTLEIVHHDPRDMAADRRRRQAGDRSALSVDADHPSGPALWSSQRRGPHWPEIFGHGRVAG